MYDVNFRLQFNMQASPDYLTRQYNSITTNLNMSLKDQNQIWQTNQDLSLIASYQLSKIRDIFVSIKIGYRTIKQNKKNNPMTIFNQHEQTPQEKKVVQKAMHVKD